MKEHGMISEFDGTVNAIEAGGYYRITLDNGAKVLGRKNGPMTKTESL
jgi:hypothetical protein